MSTETKEDYLEVDQPIPGQQYACLSFVSPEVVLKQKELFMFNKFMNQKCGEFEEAIDKITKKASDDLKNKIDRDLKSKLKLELKYTYHQFKDKFEDFIYKYTNELQTSFDKQCDFKTNVRGVKVRGVYGTYNEAQTRAKVLQRMDRSFHVFVGQVGYWLPWDPQADNVANEEYLEDELNTMMKEYKKNEINKDLFYEEQKREKQQDAMKERLASEKKQKEALENTTDSLNDVDPWMKSKFSDAEASEESKEESKEEKPAEPEAEEPKGESVVESNDETPASN